MPVHVGTRLIASCLLLRRATRRGGRDDEFLQWKGV